MLPPDALADLRRAASLQPGDYQTVASAAMAEVMSFILRSGQKPEWARGGVWKAMPESSRQALREAMKRLAPLSESKETDAAIGASLALGYLHFLANDVPEADELARRAIRLAPNREVSWDMLAGMMALNNRFKEMVPLCQERLKSRDTSRNHLLLAKALEKTGQLEQAQAQVYESLKTDPDGFIPNLALAVLLMKRSDGDATLREVGDILARIEQKQRASFTRDEYVEFLFSYGIYTALSGNDREAETVFRRVLELDNSLQEAREALRALGKDAS
jgi:tetratricopeptide (TPR) repeat protein